MSYLLSFNFVVTRVVSMFLEFDPKEKEADKPPNSFENLVELRGIEPLTS